MTAPPDPYKILQVDPEAEDEVIAAAYRRLARKYHPDVATGSEPAARMAGINAAWELIGDPVRRAAFDRERNIQAALGRSAAEAAARDSARAAPPTSPAGASSAGAPSGGSASSGSHRREPESVSRDWSSGRSTVGSRYDASMRTADGEGAAGQPPGNASGSVMNFGRYNGWSLGEIAGSDLEYLEWLDRMPIGRPYRDEIDTILRQAGRRRSADDEGSDRRGLFRRR